MTIEKGVAIMSSPQLVFESIPKEDPFHLFKGSQPDIHKVQRVLKFTKKDTAKASNVPESSVRWDDRTPKELIDRVTEWAIAIALVSEYFNDFDKTILWFAVPNTQLGGITPRDMIRIGRFKKLLKYIQVALAENKK
jgi:hypothetical protein